MSCHLNSLSRCEDDGGQSWPTVVAIGARRRLHRRPAVHGRVPDVFADPGRRQRPRRRFGQLDGFGTGRPEPLVQLLRPPRRRPERAGPARRRQRHRRRRRRRKKFRRISVDEGEEGGPQE